MLQFGWWEEKSILPLKFYLEENKYLNIGYIYKVRKINIDKPLFSTMAVKG